jgi:uncharacterized protein
MPASSRAPRFGPAFAFVAASLLLAVGAATAVEPEFPALTGRVVDAAGILTPSVRDALTQLLARQEASTGQQIVVVTLKSLQGYTIEEYGYQLGRHWGIGQKGENNGALLIVVPRERKVRIEVGYGLEDRLTDAASRTIIDQQMLPYFRRGDYSSGIVEGTAAILRALGGGQPTSVTATKPRRISDTVFPLIALFLVFLGPAVALFWALRPHHRRWYSADSGVENPMATGLRTAAALREATASRVVAATLAAGALPIHGDGEAATDAGGARPHP